MRRDGFRHLHVAQRVGDGCDLKPGDGDDVAGLGMDDRHACQPAEGEKLGRARAFDLLAVADAAP